MIISRHYMWRINQVGHLYLMCHSTQRHSAVFKPDSTCKHSRIRTEQCVSPEDAADRLLERFGTNYRPVHRNGSIRTQCSGHMISHRRTCDMCRTCTELVMVLRANRVAQSLMVDWLSNAPCVSRSSTATCGHTDGHGLLSQNTPDLTHKHNTSENHFITNGRFRLSVHIIIL